MCRCIFLEQTITPSKVAESNLHVSYAPPNNSGSDSWCAGNICSLELEENPHPNKGFDTRELAAFSVAAWALP
jgi:hypothetical protein